MKPAELTGYALDWAVAKCEDVYCFDGTYKPSTNWAQGGEIVEREKIELFIRDEKWFAYSSNSTPEDFYGETPLIAAMRCYVAGKLGDEVEIPTELTQGETA